MNFQRFWELGPEHMKFIASDFIALEEINNRSIIFDSQVPTYNCMPEPKYRMENTYQTISTSVATQQTKSKKIIL